MAVAMGYIRVSTVGQAEDGVSLEAQRERIAAWCLANDVEPGEVFVDAGLSGKRADNRPALQRALEAACRTRGVLVVYSLSRLARSVKDTILIAERLDKAGADLVSLSERIDTTSAAGKMLFRLLAVLAEFERDLVAERTKITLAHKRRRNERVGTVPYGRDLASDGVALVENTSERDTLGLIAQWRSAGMSLRKIAAELTRRAIPTKNGGTVWCHATVARIVKRAA